MKFNSTWLRSGMSVLDPRPHRSITTVLPVRSCMDRGAHQHQPHLHNGHYCPGYRIDQA